MARAYDVFFDKAGMALRGTFLVDIDGVIRFAEANGPGRGAGPGGLEAGGRGAALPRREAASADAVARSRVLVPSVAYSAAAGSRSSGRVAGARSSAGEHPVYTRAVGGSNPSAPTSVTPKQQRSARPPTTRSVSATGLHHQRR